jgi:hypothetical protein
MSHLSVIVMLVTVSVIEQSAWAQEKEAKSEAKERAKAKGYLPPLYKDVIDGVQRDKIYKIQEGYDKQIEALQAQIVDLRTKRDSEIAALLTPEQKARMQELAKAAKEKKEADAKAKASAKPKSEG